MNSEKMNRQAIELARSRIYEILREVGVVDDKQIELYADRVRDREDIRVYRCRHSGVIFLGRTDHINSQHYVEKDLSDWSFRVGSAQVPYMELENAERQASRFGHLVDGKAWLDFGCGGAALLELLRGRASQAWGVEPTLWYADPARAKGLQVVSSLDALGDRQFDVITLFHVFEHLLEPIEIARSLRDRLKPGGVLLVEVPHARDFLLDRLDSEAFRKFTLWSEHLVLHTRNSLNATLRAAGFSFVDVMGVQRFPLSNHLYWLRHGAPGGHEKWAVLNSPDLQRAYETMLDRIDATDTIMAIASR